MSTSYTTDSELTLQTFQQSRGQLPDSPVVGNRMTKAPTIPYDLQNLLPRWAALCGYVPAKSKVAKLAEHQVAYEKFEAVVMDLAHHGVSRLRAEQERQIREAVKTNSTMPVVPPVAPDLQNSNQRAIGLVREQQRTQCIVPAAPIAVEIMEAFIASARKHLDGITDAEKELSSHLGLAYQTSPTCALLQYVLDNRLPEMIEERRDTQYIHGSPKSLTCGLVQ